MHKDFDIVKVGIDTWSNKFAELYKGPDSHRSIEEFWTAVMAHISIVGEEIRKVDYFEILNAAASAFCWICSYATKCNNTPDPIFSFKNTVGEMIALKFPSICGHCTAMPCGCNPKLMDEKSDKAGKYTKLYEAWRKNPGWGGWTVRDFINMFYDLYSANIHIQPLDNIGFHLLEEAGEEAQAVRQLIQFRGILNSGTPGIDGDYLDNITNVNGLVPTYIEAMNDLKNHYEVGTESEAKEAIEYDSDNPIVIKARLVRAKMDMVIELADTFSWLCAVILKVEEAIRNVQAQEKGKEAVVNEIYFEEALAKKYNIEKPDDNLKCYACKQEECVCKFYPIAT